MSRASVRVQVAGLNAAVKQTLTLYNEDINGLIYNVAEDAIIGLYDETKATAPVDRGRFKKAIAWREHPQSNSLYGARFVWYVKAPYYRLTHLIIRSHATKNGGRTRANDFLSGPTAKAVAKFENGIKEALRNG